MNSHVFRLATTGLLGCFLLAGCFAASPQVSYYSLYAPAQKPAPTAPTTGDLAASVGPVTIPDILKQTQIATGGADGRYRLSEYHRWSGEVDRDFARALAEQLAGALGTEQVAVFPWDQHFMPTHRVLVDVLSMGGEVGKDATLAVRWSLIDPKGERTPVVRRGDFNEPTTSDGYPGWVAAQQRNIVKLGEEVTAAIKATVNPR